MDKMNISAGAFLNEARQPATKVIDVRTPAEFRALHLPDSINVPLDTLDATICHQLGEKTEGDCLYILCGTGKRAGMAREVLAQHMDCRIALIEGGINELQQQGVQLAAGRDNTRSA